MTDVQYTVKAIAQRIVLTDEPDEVARVIEQLRYWTREGLLKPATRKHSGSGRWRRYDVEQVYRASLLCELARRGLSVGSMSLALMWIKVQAQREKGLWDAAVEGKDDIFLVIWFHRHADDCFGHLTKCPHEIVEKLAGRPLTTYIFNLTRIFELVRL